DMRYPSATAFRAALLAAGRGAAPAEPLTIAPLTTSADDATVATVAREGDHTPSSPPAFVRTERGWLVPTVVIVVVAASLIGAGVLFTGGTDRLPSLPGIGGGAPHRRPAARTPGA